MTLRFGRHRPLPLSLSRDLARLETWLKRWRIKPNPNKTQEIIFHHSDNDTKNSLTDNHVQFKLCSCLKLSATEINLGIIFFKTLACAAEAKRTLSKAWFAPSPTIILCVGFSVSRLCKKERVMFWKLLWLDCFHPSGKMCKLAGAFPIDANLNGYFVKKVDEQWKETKKKAPTPRPTATGPAGYKITLLP